MTEDEKRVYDLSLKNEAFKFKLRIRYWAIIFALLSVFLIIVAPGTINPNALENFSFASSLISIVLAVVSIVFSFRTVHNAEGNLAGIREIERGINKRLENFDSLKIEIEEIVIKNTKPIKDDVCSLKESQVKASVEIQKLAEMMINTSQEKSGDLLIENKTTAFGALFMYIAALSFEHSKSFSFDSFGERIEVMSKYMIGYGIALYTLHPELFEFKFDGDKFSVPRFDKERLGASDYWENRIISNADGKKLLEIIADIESYFCSPQAE